MSNKQTGKTAGKVITYILLLLVAVALAGVIFRLTDGFTSDFKTFYITVNGEEIMTSAGGYKLTPNEPLRVGVRYVFNQSDGEASGYTVKVVPRAVEGKDFDFTLNGEVYSFQAESDLTEGFAIEREADRFTIAPKGNTEDILKAVYPEDEVVAENKVYEDMYELIVTSYNGKACVSVYFFVAISVTDVSLEPKEILF